MRAVLLRACLTLAVGLCSAEDVTDVGPVVQKIGEDVGRRGKASTVRRDSGRGVVGALHTLGAFQMAFQGNHEEEELGEPDASSVADASLGESNRLLAHVTQRAKEQKFSPSAVETIKKIVLEANGKMHPAKGRCQLTCSDECWREHLSGPKKHVICDLPDFTEKGQARLGAVAPFGRFKKRNAYPRNCERVMPKPFQPGAWSMSRRWLHSTQSDYYKCTRQGLLAVCCVVLKTHHAPSVAQVSAWVYLGCQLWQGQTRPLQISTHNHVSPTKNALLPAQQECWLRPGEGYHLHQVSGDHHSFEYAPSFSS